MLRTSAPAKVNWTLEVLGRRPDGYHEVATILTTVSLHDSLSLMPAPAWQVTIDAPSPLREELERPGSNLVWRAVRLLTDAVGPLAPPAGHLHLHKRIPAAAGLGGGSSDAAAALRLIAAYWRTMAPDAWRSVHRRLPQLASSLGSDVPFFLAGGLQLATGRGERLERLSGRTARRQLVIVTPPLHIPAKTARLYGLLRPGDFSSGEATQSAARRLASAPRDGLVGIAIINCFERAFRQAFPEIDDARRSLEAATGTRAHLCGAGPSLFALVDGDANARRAAAQLRRAGWQAVAGHTVGAAASAVRREQRPPEW